MPILKGTGPAQGDTTSTEARRRVTTDTQPPPPPSGGGTPLPRGSGALFPGFGSIQAPVGDVDVQALNALRASRLQAAIAAIAAQFGLSEAELQAELAAINPGLAQILQLAETQRQTGIEQAEAVAGRRGLQRSGIFAEQVGDVQAAFANQQAQATAGAQSQASGLQNQIASLAQQRAIAEQQARLEADREQFDNDVILALARRGLSF
jgi:hypothetical protein